MHRLLAVLAIAAAPFAASAEPPKAEAPVATTAKVVPNARPATPVLKNTDVETLAVLVMTEAANDANRDLRAIMEDMQGLNKSEHSLRQRLTQERRLKALRPTAQSAAACQGSRAAWLACLQRIRASFADPRLAGAADAKQIVADIDLVQTEIDSMGDLGERQQLKMQLAMERMAKAQATLSNLLKKQSETSAAIVQNIK